MVLFRFDPPQQVDDGLRWHIRGGLLSAGAGGEMELRWRDGELRLSIAGYVPRLPRPLYQRTQLPLHHLVTRHSLLQVRGRRPPPGVPVSPAGRLAAATLDIALCAAAGGLLARRGRLTAALAVTPLYHLGFWSLGRTPGGWLVGQRLVAVDGSRATPVQAAIRLLTLPVAWHRLRAVHDELAATDLIRAPRPYRRGRPAAG